MIDSVVGLQFGITDFSSAVQETHALGEVTDAQIFAAQVDSGRIPHLKQSTLTATGMKFSRDTCITRCRASPVECVFFIITDGNPIMWEIQTSIDVAGEIRAMGTTVYALGFGNDIDYSLLMDYTGQDPDKVFTVATPDGLGSILDTVLDSFCPGGCHSCLCTHYTLHIYFTSSE